MNLLIRSNKGNFTEIKNCGIVSVGSKPEYAVRARATITGDSPDTLILNALRRNQKCTSANHRRSAKVSLSLLNCNTVGTLEQDLKLAAVRFGPAFFLPIGLQTLVSKSDMLSVGRFDTVRTMNSKIDMVPFTLTEINVGIFAAAAIVGSRDVNYYSEGMLIKAGQLVHLLTKIEPRDVVCSTYEAGVYFKEHIYLSIACNFGSGSNAGCNQVGGLHRLFAAIILKTMTRQEIIAVMDKAMEYILRPKVLRRLWYCELVKHKSTTSLGERDSFVTINEITHDMDVTFKMADRDMEAICTNTADNMRLYRKACTLATLTSKCAVYGKSIVDRMDGMLKNGHTINGTQFMRLIRDEANVAIELKYNVTKLKEAMKHVQVKTWFVDIPPSGSNVSQTDLFSNKDSDAIFSALNKMGISVNGKEINNGSQTDNSNS